MRQSAPPPRRMPPGMPPQNALTDGPPPDSDADVRGFSPDDGDMGPGDHDSNGGDEAPEQPSPEMVAAGVQALTKAPPGAKPEEIVAAIFQAMESADKEPDDQTGAPPAPPPSGL